MREFYQEVAQRKSLAHQAKYRKNGSKSKKCTLPSDSLTPKQRAKLNGEVVTIQLNKPYSWTEFTGFPPDMQRDYLYHIRDTFGARTKEISEMFGISTGTLRNHLTNQGIAISFKNGRFGMTDEQADEWRAFLGAQLLRPKLDSSKATESQSEPKEVTTVRNPAGMSAMTMQEFSISFAGQIDVQGIANSLLHILGQNASGEVQITCRLAGDRRM